MKNRKYKNRFQLGFGSINEQRIGIVFVVNSFEFEDLYGNK